MTLMLTNSELVACGWLASIPGWSTAMVGTTLPRIPASGPLPPWIGTGFVTVATVGGTPAAYTPEAQPVVSVNCWAVNATGNGLTGAPINVSNKPPWGKAALLAEQIRAAAYVLDKSSARSVAMPVPGYTHATVMGAQLMTEPRRMPSDVASYARYQLDVQLFWTAGSQ